MEENATEKKLSNITDAPKQNGGARAGAGRKPGSPNKITAEVKILAQQYGEEAILCLANIMRLGDTSAARVAAAKEILDRAYGKSVQYQEIDARHTVAPTLADFYAGVANATIASGSDSDDTAIDTDHN